jgi:hypothetical protein
MAAADLPMGRLGLSQQLVSHGWRAMQAERLALVASAAQQSAR